MVFHPHRIEDLSRADCVALLGTVPVGRIGLSMNALPVVLPVNFCLNGSDIIIRTSEGAKLDAALAQTVVAFEADAFDPMDHTGWSVLVRGTSRVLTVDPEDGHMADLHLLPWADEGADRFVAIGMEMVSGRWIRGWRHDHGVHQGVEEHPADEEAESSAAEQS